MSQTTAVKKSSIIPARMIIAGVLTTIAGWMTRNYAASRMRRPYALRLSVTLRAAPASSPLFRWATSALA
jgi:hypothetical protein